MYMAAATTTTATTTTTTTTTTVETDGDELYPTTYDGPTNVVSILPNGKVNMLIPRVVRYDKENSAFGGERETE